MFRMYSEELLRKLQEKNFIIDNEEYMNFFTPKDNPQINYMELVDKENGVIRMHTNDNYDLKFKVYQKKR